MNEPWVITLGNRGLLLKVRELAAKQAGVVARRQLLARGISEAAIDRARKSGRLFDLHPAVYSVMPPELLGIEGRLIAALLASGRRASLSHGTAAWRAKLIPYPPPLIELTTPDRLNDPEGVRLHRCTTFRHGDLTRIGRFRCTSVPRTLLDLAVGYDRKRLLAALAQAEFEHNVRPDDVVAVLRRGHPGSANLRAALKEHVPGYGVTKSRLEKRFRRVLIRAGIELPERNQPVGPYKVDCLWPNIKLVVELDGGQHGREHQANVDAARDLWLRRNGYTVRRYSWEQVRDRTEDVLADLHDALEEARSRNQPPNPLPLSAAVSPAASA